MSQQGFTLIEVLFAVLILSVGILGMAGLQVTSVQENRSALLRAQAVQLANSMLDRLRANPTATYQSVTYADAPSTVTNCMANSCDVAQMAAFDTTEWQCSINSTDAKNVPYPACTALGITGQLPGGAGQMEIAGANRFVQVSVRWQDSPKGSTSSITLESKLPQS